MVDIEPHKSLSVSISLTATPQIPKEKRLRKDDSPSITEVSVEEFGYTTRNPKPLMLLTCLVRKSPTLPQ